MEVLCGQCGKTLEVDASAKIALCPHCSREILMPAPGAGPQDESSAEEAGFAEQARAAMERKIRVVCGKCGRGLIVPVRMSGKQTQCPACESSIQIPSQDDETEILEKLITRNGGEAESLAIDEPTVLETPASEPEADESPAQKRPAGRKHRHRRKVHAKAPAPAAQAPTTQAQAGQTPNAVEFPSPAPAEPAKQAAQEQPQEQQADAGPETRRLASLENSKRLRDLALLGLVCIFALCAIVGIVHWFSGQIESREQSEIVSPSPTSAPAGGSVAPSPTPAAYVTPTPGSVIATPSPSATQAPIASPTPTPPQGRIACTAKVLSSRVDYFASGGYYPARPGCVYWAVNLELSVQAGEAKIQTYGPAVVIQASAEDGGTIIPSLGLQVAAGTLPTRARQVELTLRPDAQPLQAALLFEVPAGVRSGKLIMKDVTEVDVAAPTLPAPPDPQVLVGRWVESQPRNLKPELAQPVMAAIQSQRDGEIIFIAKGEELSIVMPQAGVQGTASPAGGDMLTARLSDSQGCALECKIRMIEAGRRLVLYLSDEPFHQITYRKAVSSIRAR